MRRKIPKRPPKILQKRARTMTRIQEDILLEECLAVDILVSDIECKTLLNVFVNEKVTQSFK
jgi:hypothetical protein